MLRDCVRLVEKHGNGVFSFTSKVWFANPGALPCMAYKQFASKRKLRDMESFILKGSKSSLVFLVSTASGSTKFLNVCFYKASLRYDP